MLIEHDDHDLLARRRLRAILQEEDFLESELGFSMRRYLARLREQLGPGDLTASILSGSPVSMSTLFTLGQAQQWWQESVSESLWQAVGQVWADGYADTSDVLITRSIDGASQFLANVQNRWVETVPNQAFDTIRVSLAQEISRGSTIDEIARRFASDLAWENPDRSLWSGRLEEINSQIDSLLDQFGPRGSSERSLARQIDPQVKAFQEQRSQIVSQLDRDESKWRSESRKMARTESTAAYNAGAYQAMSDEGAGFHMWIATGLAVNPRLTHLEAHEQCVALDSPFEVGGELLMFPGDPSGSPEETYNCRCTTIGANSCGGAREVAAPARGVIDEQRERQGLSPIDWDVSEA